MDSNILIDAFGIIYLRRGLIMGHNTAKVTWAHGVNDKGFLKSCLQSDINMLEADVLIGRLSSGKETEIAIMAHPPNDVSDLSLLEFVIIVDDFNKISSAKKGIKLDFKSIVAFEAAIGSENFINILSKANYPVWLNADILDGPLAASYVKPVDAARFLKGCKLFPKAVLSLGWTTGFNSTKKANYTDHHVQEMLKTLDLHEIKQPVTFPVRAGLVAESQEQINVLLKNNTHTLTIWSGINDNDINVTKLNAILDNIEVGRIYVDVPDDLRNQLNVVKSLNATNVVRT